MEGSSSSVRERARTETAIDDQDSLFDKIIENDILAAALDKREKLRQAKLKAKAQYDEAHATARAQIDAVGLSPGDVARCGRHKIKKGLIGESAHVEFETTPSSRLTISMLKD